MDSTNNVNEFVKVICTCDIEYSILLNEEFNYKDSIDCVCGKRILIVDISEDL